MNLEPGLVVVPAVLVVFALLQRFVPPAPEPDAPPITDEERAAFRPWELGAVAIAVVLAIALFFPWCGVFRLLELLALRTGADAPFVLAPGPDAVKIPALFCAIVSAMPATEVALRALLRGRHARFDRYAREKATFDTRKVTRVLTWAVAALTLAFYALWDANVARVGPDGLDVRRGLALGRERIPYARVRAVEARDTFRAPNGNAVWGPHHAVVLDDGTEWTTHGALRTALPSDAAAMAYVAERAGRTVTRGR